ncbi:MAG: hypothetical protein K8T10_20675 [Candidatus Eremiobacteraeota bacterium]|nr:hypothetical protein [Candidatus Eremiobacteraeota bacterium]
MNNSRIKRNISSDSTYDDKKKRGKKLLSLFGITILALLPGYIIRSSKWLLTFLENKIGTNPGEIWLLWHNFLGKGNIYSENSLPGIRFLSILIRQLGGVITYRLYYLVICFLLCFCALGIVYLLFYIIRSSHGEYKRIFIFWILAPSFIFYGFFDFNLIPVFFTVLAYMLFAEEEYVLASAVLGIGCGFSIFPIFLVPLIIFTAPAKFKWKSIITFIIVLVLMNGVFAIRNPGNWYKPYVWEFTKNISTIAGSGTYWWILNKIPGKPGVYSGYISLILFFMGSIIFLVKKKDFPISRKALGLAILFLLTHRSFNPAQLLYLLPFLAIAGFRIPLPAFYAIEIINVSQSLFQGYFFKHPAQLQILVFIKLILLVFLFYRLCKENVGGEETYRKKIETISVESGEKESIIVLIRDFIFQRRIAILIFIALAIFISPMFIRYTVREKQRDTWKPGWIESLSCDEPHYLVMINSIIEDFDLYLGNNYKNIRFRSKEEGGNLAQFWYLDHHSIFVNKKTGEKYIWGSVVHWGNREKMDENNIYKNWEWDIITFSDQKYFKRDLTLEERNAIKMEDLREVPIHSPGMPIVASILAFPFQKTRYAEKAARVATFLMTLIALYFTYLTIKFYAPKFALPTTLIIAFATPVWTYSKTLWSEMYSAAFLIIAIYFIVVKKKAWVSGIFLSLTVFTKPTFAILAVFIYIYLILIKEYKQIAFFTITLSLGALLHIWYNSVYLAAPFATSMSFVFGNPLKGLIGTLFWGEYALFPAAPILLLAIPGFGFLHRDKPKDAIFLGLSIMAFVVVIACWKYSTGGLGGFSSRLLIPIIPVLAIPLAVFLQNTRGKLPWALVVILLIPSVIFNCLAAYDNLYCWGRPAWAILWQMFG